MNLQVILPTNSIGNFSQISCVGSKIGSQMYNHPFSANKFNHSNNKIVSNCSLKKLFKDKNRKNNLKSEDSKNILSKMEKFSSSKNKNNLDEVNVKISVLNIVSENKKPKDFRAEYMQKCKFKDKIFEEVKREQMNLKMELFTDKEDFMKESELEDYMRISTKLKTLKEELFLNQHRADFRKQLDDDNCHSEIDNEDKTKADKIINSCINIFTNKLLLGHGKLGSSEGTQSLLKTR